MPIFSPGEDKVSYGYDSSGKKALDSEFTEYGQSFGADDVIGCYLVSLNGLLFLSPSLVFLICSCDLICIPNGLDSTCILVLNSSTIDKLGEWCLDSRARPQIKPSRMRRVSMTTL